MKKNTGITLVALVITIIILLILAGVAISMITGGEGLFAQANGAAGIYNQSAKNEADLLNQLFNGNDTNIPPKQETIKTDGSYDSTEKVNTPDTSKLPTTTTKYVTWTGTDTFTPQESSEAVTDWYDYNNGQWANIKTVSADNTLEAYWVWIPRFAYKLPESSAVKQIEVAFVKNTSKTVVLDDGTEVEGYYSTDTEITTGGTGLYTAATDLAKGTNGQEQAWIIHPAFWWDNNSNGIIEEGEQLPGIWVGKFETISSNPSAQYGGGNDISNLKAQIKPGYASWRYIQVANMFTVCENMKKTGGVIGTTESNNSEIDTHMMKNMEWGAVAILSQSKYGVYNPKSTNGGQVWNNPNSSSITGTAAKAADSENAGTVTDTDCDRFNTGNGPKVSTTGTVYGVYDMAGGTYESVMGLMSPSTDATIPSVGYNATFNTGFNGKYCNGKDSTNGIRDLPDRKYYDMYAYGTSATDYSRGKIGDATSELQPANYRGWNSDYAYFVYSDNPVFGRAGTHYHSTNAGVFYFYRDYGSAGTNFGFRAVLLAV